jgi:hypothetical protein
MTKSEAFSNLIAVAGVFTSTEIPSWLPDEAVVGKIGSTQIFVGEVRRLNQVLQEIQANPVWTDRPPLRDEVIELVQRERVIEAIKLVRGFLDMSLVEAKSYVDTIRAEENL